MENPSRRQVLAVAAATVTIPMLESALGTLKSAQAQATTAPATAPAGWVTTKLKAADLKDNEFTAVEGQKILVARKDKKVTAMSNVCTHRQCALTPAAGQASVVCRCHQSSFNLEGGVTKAPATRPLDVYAIRANAQGLIEIDPSKAVAKDAKEASLMIP